MNWYYIKKSIIVVLGLKLLFIVQISGLLLIEHMTKKTIKDETQKTKTLTMSELIETYALAFGLDPDFVKALIYAESRFDPQSESHRGARGLMQLMPNTAAQLAEELDIKDFSVEKLFDPSVNIQLGCYYLSKIQKKLGSDHQVILAAYNAGPYRVLQWLQTNDKNLIVSTFPYAQTRGYIEKINAYMTENL